MLLCLFYTCPKISLSLSLSLSLTLVSCHLLCPQHHALLLSHVPCFVSASHRSCALPCLSMPLPRSSVLCLLNHVDRQGATTPIYPVLAAATGIKMQSMDQDCLTATVKKSKALSGVDQTIKRQF